jgi:hypothetical protein
MMELTSRPQRRRIPELISSKKVAKISWVAQGCFGTCLPFYLGHVATLSA